MELEQLQLLHRMSFSRRNPRSYVVVLHDPKVASTELEFEVGCCSRMHAAAMPDELQHSCLCHIISQHMVSLMWRSVIVATGGTMLRMLLLGITSQLRM
jgi:hypothetical protein